MLTAVALASPSNFSQLGRRRYKSAMRIPRHRCRFTPWHIFFANKGTDTGCRINGHGSGSGLDYGMFSGEVNGWTYVVILRNEVRPLSEGAYIRWSPSVSHEDITAINKYVNGLKYCLYH